MKKSNNFKMHWKYMNKFFRFQKKINYVIIFKINLVKIS